MHSGLGELFCFYDEVNTELHGSLKHKAYEEKHNNTPVDSAERVILADMCDL